jgi:hypothetical protein
MTSLADVSRFIQAQTDQISDWNLGIVRAEQYPGRMTMLELQCRCGRAFDTSDAESAVQHFEDIHIMELPSRQAHGWEHDLAEVEDGVSQFIRLAIC